MSEETEVLRQILGELVEHREELTTGRKATVDAIHGLGLKIESMEKSLVREIRIVGNRVHGVDQRLELVNTRLEGIDDKLVNISDHVLKIEDRQVAST
jgi:hypothetical protein